MKKILMILCVFVAITSLSSLALAGSTSSSDANATAIGGSANASATGGSANASATGISGDVAASNVQDVGGITVNNNAAQPRDLTTVSNHGYGYRDLPTSGNVPIPGSPGYFGPTTPGAAFQTIKAILLYKHTFSLDQMNRMAATDGKTKVIVTAVEPSTDLANSMSVVIGKVETSMTVVGYITVRAKNDNTVSVKDLAAAMLAARNLGADTIHVTGEGVERVLKAFGWGLGASYTRATINAGENAGGVAAGGTGISGGSAGYHDSPWLQLVALKTAK